MITKTYSVQGMTCGHCEAAVTEELASVQGVTDVRVDLAGGTVTVVSDREIGDDIVGAAIDEAGYTLVTA